MQQGCAPVAVAGGAAGATFTAAEERGVSGAWDDTKIKSKILWKYNKKSQGLFGVVDVVVRQGKVLLTGTVEDPLKKVDAVRFAWEVPGVKAVVDEVKVGKDSINDFAKDSWITTQLKTNLVFNGDVHSINFNLQTINQTVYIMGVARSRDELERVIHTARTISGVKEVVNYAVIGKAQKSKVN